MSAAEQASEKYLGQNHLKDLNVIAPKINVDKLVSLINEANQLLEHCVKKYSFDILASKEGFYKQLSTIIQVVEIDTDHQKILALSHKINEEVKQCSADLALMNAALTPLSAIYNNQDYLTSILPDADEYARTVPRIVGVVQVATLKRESIANAISQAKAVELELVHFSDSTMFQIREGLSRVGDITELKKSVQETIHNKLQLAERTLSYASLISASSMGVVGIALVFGLIGFPMPINQIGAGASFVFVMFIFSLSMAATAGYMIYAQAQKKLVFGHEFNSMIKGVSTVASVLLGLSGLLLYLDRNSFEFFQLFPIASICLAIAGGFFAVFGLFAKRQSKTTQLEMLGYKTRICK